MRRLRIHEAAAEEAAEAAAWYETERPGLGADFEKALNAAFDVLEQDFPYAIIVKESPTEVFVIAVAHHARRPAYWRGRLPLPGP